MLIRKRFTGALPIPLADRADPINPFSRLRYSKTPTIDGLTSMRVPRLTKLRACHASLFEAINHSLSAASAHAGGNHIMDLPLLSAKRGITMRAAYRPFLPQVEEEQKAQQRKSQPAEGQNAPPSDRAIRAVASARCPVQAEDGRTEHPGQGKSGQRTHPACATGNCRVKLLTGHPPWLCFCNQPPFIPPGAGALSSLDEPFLPRTLCPVHPSAGSFIGPSDLPTDSLRSLVMISRAFPDATCPVSLWQESLRSTPSVPSVPSAVQPCMHSYHPFSKPLSFTTEVTEGKRGQPETAPAENR
jgi:hypothetical protein